jgi:hypothetical protein
MALPQVKNENRTDADWAAIDARYNLLPGDQGEHDFSVIESFVEVYDRLNNYAEECGGLASANRSAKRIYLCAGYEGEYRIYFSDDLSRVIRVAAIDGGNETPYWDSSKPRKYDGYYQTGNV